MGLSLVLACIFGNVLKVEGQILMTGTGSYTQDFNTLSSTGSSNAWTDNTTITGWFWQRTGSGTTYATSGTAGNAYSFGSTSASDRAMGSIGSGNATAGNFACGVYLKNTSGSTLSNISVAYTGEQWRNENVGAQTVTFWFKKSTSAISSLNPNVNTGWTAVTALDFTSPKINLTAATLDGNLAANRTVVSSVIIPGLTLADNEFLMLKWDDPDHTGSDHGLAIDDVTVSWSLAVACSGAPAPGNTIATPTAVSSGSTVNLSLQNTTTGTGVTYLWYSSTTSSTGPWTSTGATGATYSPTITAKTWFQCVVTCSGSSTTSTPVMVTLAPCTTSLYSTGCSSNDMIDNISISDLNQTSTGCTGGAGFADYTSTIVNFSPSTSYPWTITCPASLTSEMVGFWIDFNDNGSFADAVEFIGGTTVASSTTTITGTVSIPLSAAIGLHRMRVRLVYGSTNTQGLTTSCTPYSYGETHDYTANIVASCTAPSTQASNVNFTTPSATSGTVTWNSGNGNGAIVVVRATSTSAVLPSNGTIYTANTVFGSGTGTAITGTGNYVVFVGSGSSVSITGLSASTAYTATVYEYNTTSQCYNLIGASASATTPCSPFTGTYSVGASNIAGEAGHYATLTAAVADYNTRCITGPLVFLLTDATYSTSETFPITINSNGYASAVNTLTIKPNTGVTATITTNSSSATIILNGADYVTIDGSNGSTTNSVCPKVQATRNLTITNTNTATSGNAVVWFQSNGSTNGATNNVIMNCIVTGNSATTTQNGIGSANSAISLTNANGGISNNSNQFINNAVSKAQFGVYSVGQSTSNFNIGTKINLNDITNCGRAGIFVGFENGTEISGNTIDGITNSTSTDALGIGVGLANYDTGTTTATSECTNTTITYNTIGVIQQTGTASAAGIVIGSSSAGTYTIQNNMISGVSSNGILNDYGTGIHIGGGAAQYNVYHNTIAMQGTIAGSTPAGTYSVCVAVPNSTFKLNLRNNILSNTQVGNTGATVKFGCIYTQSSPTYSNFISNYNDLFCAGSGPGSYQIGFYGGGSAQSTIAIWRTNTSLDANSINVSPVFTSSTNVHLQAVIGNSSFDNSGTNLSISNDIDCETRSSTPDIGADEFVVGACSGVPNAGTASITVSSGCNYTNFSVSATGLTSGTGITYQWQSSPTGLAGTWTNISAATSATYSTSVTSTTYYQLVTTCSNGGGTNVTNSVSFTVPIISCTCFTYPSVYANFVADNDLTSVTVGSMTNTSNCGDLAPGAGSIAYQYSNYAGNVTGPSAAQGASVAFSLTENLCSGGINNQNYFLIYIDWNQDGDFADANEKVYSQIDLIANGTLPSVSYLSTQTISGYFTVPMSALTGVTRMRVINTNGAFPSNNYAQTDSYSWGETEDYCFTVTAASGPNCPNASSISPTTAQTICQNATATQLTASYTTGGVTGTPTVQYQWYYNTTNSNTISGATLISGANSSTYTPPTSVSGTRYYFCVVYALDNGCAQTNANQSLASNAVQVTIVDPASVTATITQGATASFCSGSSVTLNANTGSGLTYQWQMNGSPIGGANSSTYPTSAAGTYSVVVTGSGGCSATSSGTVVSSNPTPTITAQTSTICSGQAFSVSPASAPSGTTYTWSAPTLNPASSITGGTAQASPQASISQTLTNTTTASATATYTVTPTAGTCVGSTFTVTVTVDPSISFGTAATVTSAGSVTHLVISQVYGGSGTAYPYDFVELFNPTNASISFTNWSIQYQTPAGTTWSVQGVISATIPSGGYYLIHFGNVNSSTATPTTADASFPGSSIGFNGTDAKIVLVNSSTAITSCTSSNIVDKVSYGSPTQVCAEGTSATIVSGKSIFRAQNGCQDNDNNSTDFSSNTISPRNSASPINSCAVAAPTTFCGSGTPGSMSVTGVSGGTSYSYQWYSQTGIVSCPTGNSTTGWTSLGSTNGANTATYTPSSAITSSTTYACLVTVNGSSCGTTQWASSCVQITINPAPSISSYTATYCGGVNFDVTPQNGTNETVPSNTTYTWAAPSVAGITGATAGAAATSITGNLVNTTDLPINVVYTVTPTTASCTGSVFTVTITVNPSPVVTQMSTSVCSGNSLTVTPTNGSNGVIPTGTVYTWNAPNQSGVTGGLSGTGTAIPTSLTGNGNVVYTITPSLSGGCTGANFLLTVAVDVCQSLGDCNVIVYRVGNGSTLLTDSAQQVSLVEFSPNGSLVQSVAGNFTGSTFLSQTATATSHGFLNSYNGFTAIPGYTSSYNTDNLASLNTKATYILSSNLTGSRVLNTSTSPVPFNGSSYRSSIPVSATTFYCSGTGTSASTGGVWYYNGTSYVQIYGSSSPTFNIRNIEIYNGQLYISTGAGSARGVYAVGTGLPTTSGQSISLFLSNDQATSSPYGFYISPDGCTAYIAEDGNVGGSTIFGIYKWSKINNVWTYQYRYPCYARGLTVDFSEANPKLYVTTASSVTASSSSIIQLTDNGTTFTQNWQQNAGTNYVFLGVDFTPNSTATISNTNNVSAQGFSVCQNGTSQTLTVAAATSSSALTYQWYSNSTNDLSGATAISGATSATYTPPISSIGITYYFVKISSNCATTNYSSIASVIVNPNPTATITPSVLCAGSTTSITASGGGTYLWANGLGTNPNISVSAAGTYSVTVSDSNNCSSTASTTISVSNPPTINAISPP